MAIDVEDYYRRFGPMVLRRCRSMLRDEEAAMDAMQDTFVQMLRHQDRLENQAPSSLLYQTATRVCLNRIRSQSRRPEDADTELLTRIAVLDDAVAVPAARRVLDTLFGAEQASTRVIAVLHLLDGLTLEETAAEVGLSVSGVRKRLRVLRRHLHELVDDPTLEGMEGTP